MFVVVVEIYNLTNSNIVEFLAIAVGFWAVLASVFAYLWAKRKLELQDIMVS